MIKVAVPHPEYLKQGVMQVPSMFIQTIREYITNSCPDMELLDVGDDQEEMVKNLRSGMVPDALVAIAASGVYAQTTQFFRRHKTKVFLFWDDLHWYENKVLKARHRIFSESQVLLLPYHNNFVRIPQFKAYHHKSRLFPWFAPMECFNYHPSWEDRKNKILLSGAFNKTVYPLRHNIFNFGKNNTEIETLKHPGYTHRGGKRNHEIIGSAYYSYMRDFKGSVGTSGTPYSCGIKTPYPICKFFEIPGCGCTPFFDEILDLEELGFIPYTHYIPIHKGNLQTALKLTEKSKSIAKNALQFILQHHSALIRAEQLCNIIREEL